MQPPWGLAGPLPRMTGRLPPGSRGGGGPGRRLPGLSLTVTPSVSPGGAWCPGGASADAVSAAWPGRAALCRLPFPCAHAGEVTSLVLRCSDTARPDPRPASSSGSIVRNALDTARDEMLPSHACLWVGSVPCPWRGAGRGLGGSPPPLRSSWLSEPPAHGRNPVLHLQRDASFVSPFYR